MLRKFRNISNSSESLIIGGLNNEWCYQTCSSKIVSLGYIKLGSRNKLQQNIILREGSANVPEQSIPLLPNQEVTIRYESEEVRRLTDERCWVFSCPTMNPTVTVKVFEGLSPSVYFGYRSRAEQLGVGTCRLKETLLLGQVIKVRWKPSANRTVNEEVILTK